MLEKVKKTIAGHRMLRRGDTVCVAVSGGVDSTVLLHVLAALAGELKLKLVVCHLDHGLRGKESVRDFNFTKRTAKRLGLRFEGKRLKKVEHAKGSLQDWARQRRYEFYEEAARKYGAGRVALGHTLDDQAETILMRFVKGSGTAGLSGMEAIRGIYIRPLLEATREEIEGYARSEGVKYVTDSSNKTRKYLRNRIRLDLLPFLEKDYNPNISETLARTAGVMARDDKFIGGEARRAFSGLLKKRGKHVVVLDRKGLKALDEALVVRVFLRAAAMLGRETGLYAPHVDSFLGLVKGKRPNAGHDLPGGLNLLREYDDITLSTKGPGKPAPFAMVLTVPGTTRVDGARIRLKASLLRKRPSLRTKDESTAYFDYDALPKPLRVRSFRAGDRMRPLGMKGHKKLKDIFIDAKVPRARRAGVPIVESGGEVIWAAGLKRAEGYRVTGKTGRVLKITLII